MTVDRQQVRDDRKLEGKVGVPPERFRWWVILLGMALIPVNSLWIARTEAMDYSGFPTCASLFYNVIFSLLVLLVLNALIRHLAPGIALCRREMMVVYAMVATGSSLVGHDCMQMVVPTVTHARYFGNTTNQWGEQVLPLLPKWLTIQSTDPITTEAVQSFEMGNSTLYTWAHLRVWIVPVAAWSSFIVASIVCMLSINVLVRRRWDEHERLAYPIVQIPLLITEGGGGNAMFRSRLFWGGFGLAAFLDLWNGLAQLYPAMPSVNLKITNNAFFSTPPWNAVGNVMTSFYPFVIGLSFFMPTNMSFSSWFFFLVRKAMQVSAASMGYQGNNPWYPYLKEQAFGALIALFAASLWFGRGYFKQVLRGVFTGRGLTDDGGVSYRWTLVMLLVGMAVMVAFLAAAGLTPWIAAIYVVLYLMFCGALTRIRAELGPPAHEIGSVGPIHMLVAGLGTTVLGPQSLTVFSLLWFQNRMHRGLLMPQQAECLKGARESGLKMSTMVFALSVAGLVGVLSAFWALMHLSYSRIGPAAHHPGAPGSGFPGEALNVVTAWMRNPISTDWGGVCGMGIGAVVALILARFSVAIYGFPFHPAGYAIGMAFGVDYIWLPVMISWLAKVLILRYCGLKGYRTAIPFFVGLVLGEFAVGGLWSFVRGIWGIQAYTFFY